MLAAASYRFRHISCRLLERLVVCRQGRTVNQALLLY